MDRLVGGAKVLLAAEVDAFVIVCQALEMERDAQPVRGAAAEKAVELHA
jgi:hypothetical protein